MEIQETIAKRRSIRRFRSSDLSIEDLKKILESARLAPSVNNLQPWTFVVIRDTQRKKEILEAKKFKQPFFSNAAVLVVALADTQTSLEWARQDVMTAVEHMVLTATSLGYGTCWLGDFDQTKIRNLLNTPEKLSTVVVLAIGVPDETPNQRPRKGFDKIFFEEEYGKTLIVNPKCFLIRNSLFLVRYSIL